MQKLFLATFGDESSRDTWPVRAFLDRAAAEAWIVAGEAAGYKPGPLQKWSIEDHVPLDVPGTQLLALTDEQFQVLKSAVHSASWESAIDESEYEWLRGMFPGVNLL